MDVSATEFSSFAEFLGLMHIICGEFDICMMFGPFRIVFQVRKLHEYKFYQMRSTLRPIWNVRAYGEVETLGKTKESHFWSKYCDKTYPVDRLAKLLEKVIFEMIEKTASDFFPFSMEGDEAQKKLEIMKKEYMISLKPCTLLGLLQTITHERSTLVEARESDQSCSDRGT